MLNRVSRIEWDVCESEQAALLRENRLLRLHRPPFNVVNTHTDQYYLIGLESRGAQPRAFALFLTNRAAHKSDLPGNRLELFGAYKGRARARDGYAALLRLFWAAHSELPERFEYPTRLVRRIPPPRYDLRFPEQMPAKEASQWLRLVRQLLNGTSRALILKLTERLLEREGIPAFYHHFIQQDLNALEEFFRDSALRNKRLRKAHGLTTRVIPQDQIDDLIVASDSRVSGMPLANARRKTT